MSIYKLKKLSEVGVEENFSSNISNHIIVEDGGSIKRVDMKDRMLPKASSNDSGKIVEVDENGKYVLKNKEIPLDATLIIE